MMFIRIYISYVAHQSMQHSVNTGFYTLHFLLEIIKNDLETIMRIGSSASFLPRIYFKFTPAPDCTELFSE